MRSGLLGTLAVLISAGWVAAQSPAATNVPSPYNGGSHGSTPPPAGVNYPPPHNAPPVLGHASSPGSPLGQPVAQDASYRGYVSFDYLLWKVRNGAIPPTASVLPVGLISVDTSDLFTVAPNLPGGFGGTPTIGFSPLSIVSTTRYGATSADYGDQSGFRLTAGCWFDDCQLCGAEVSAFLLERGSDQFAAVAAASGNQFIVDTGFRRNLFLVQGGAQSLLSTFPIIAIRETVARTVGTSANQMFGAELNVRSNCVRFGCIDFGCLAGFRYVHFQDEIAINNQFRLFRPPGYPITLGDSTASLSSDLSFTTFDRIRAYNNFLGAQIGGEMDAKFGAFFLNTRVKAGLGTILQHAKVDSETRLINNDPNGPTPPGVLSRGGLLAGPGDVGEHDRTRFGTLWEVNVKAGYQVAECCRAYVGFDGLYLGHITRAAGNSVVNSLATNVTVAGGSNAINVSAPAFRFREQDIFVRGFNLGLEFRY